MISRGTSQNWRCVTWPLTPCRVMKGTAGQCRSTKVAGWEAALLAAAGTSLVDIDFISCQILFLLLIIFFESHVAHLSSLRSCDLMLQIYLFVFYRNILDKPSVSDATVRGGWRPRGRGGTLHCSCGSDAERSKDAAPSRGQIPHHRIFHLRGTDHINPKSLDYLMCIHWTWTSLKSSLSLQVPKEVCPCWRGTLVWRSQRFTVLTCISRESYLI